jgi:hypothetical protein
MKLTPINIANGVLLFKDVLKDTSKTYQFVRDLKDNPDPYFKWEEWSTGNYRKDSWGIKAISEPSKEYSYKTSNSGGAEIQKECLDIFFEAIKCYKQNFIDHKYFDNYLYSKNLPESYMDIETGINREYSIEDLVLFGANGNLSNDWHMDPHQDLIHWWGDNRITFNFNIYLNNDYEGGEIIFYNYNGEEAEYTDSFSGNIGKAMVMEDAFIYKPKAGDALLIQADSWHGVMPMKNSNPKYYIRQILRCSDHPEKAKNISQLGSKYTDFFEKEKKLVYDNRKTPIHFSSLDKIDFDSEKYDKNRQVPFIIKGYKNLLEKTGE